jgi:8-oxo-dGTP pyrophosphatase MutT (NUDIX family)
MTDTRARVLIVHPARPDAPWTLPGGAVDPHEAPSAAVEREVLEELGLRVRIRPDDLLTVEWLAATRPGRRDRFAMVFAGPVPTDAAADRIVLQDDELDGWRFEPPAQARPAAPADGRPYPRPAHRPRHRCLP